MNIWDSDVTAAFALFILLSFTLHFTALSLVLIGPQCGPRERQRHMIQSLGVSIFSKFLNGFHIFQISEWIIADFSKLWSHQGSTGYTDQPTFCAKHLNIQDLPWVDLLPLSLCLRLACAAAIVARVWRREVGDEFTQSFGYGQMDYQEFLDG